MPAISVPYRLTDASGGCRSVLATVNVDSSGRMSAPVSWLDGTVASTTAPAVPSGGSLQPGECCTVAAGAFGAAGSPETLAERVLVGAMPAGLSSYSPVSSVPIVNPSSSRPLTVVLHGRVVAEEAGAAVQTASWRAYGELDPGTGVFAGIGIADNAHQAASSVTVPWTRTLTIPAGTTVTVRLRARPYLLGPRDFIADGRAAITLDTWVGIFTAGA